MLRPITGPGWLSWDGFRVQEGRRTRDLSFQENDTELLEAQGQPVLHNQTLCKKLNWLER